MKNLQNICSFTQLFQLKYLFSLRKWLRAQAQARECVITAPRGQLSARRLSGFLFLATPRVDTWQQQQLSQSESAGFLGWARGLAAPASLERGRSQRPLLVTTSRASCAGTVSLDCSVYGTVSDSEPPSSA